MEAHTLFLGGGGPLYEQVPQEGTAEFVFDPMAPTPSIVGNTMASDAGIRVNTDLEARGDVLVFTMPELEEDRAVIGHPVCVLDIASSDPEHDIFVRICGIDGCGRSTNVVDEIIRRGASDSGGDASGRGLLTIALQGTAHRFKSGHRIRLQVSGGAFPRFSVNRGSEQDPEGRAVPVRHTLEFGSPRAGFLGLPVVDNFTRTRR